jgi:WD40 repeat protein/uncharacterized caspase-like protein
MLVRLLTPVCLFCLIAFANICFAQPVSPKLMLPIGSKLEILSAQFSPDGKRIVTASADKTAMVWDAVTGNLLLILDDHKDIVSYAEYSPDGKRIVTSSYDNLIRMWDAETGEQLYALKGHKDSIFSARFSPDGRKIVSASADGTAKLWDAATRRLIADLSGHDAKVNSAEFSHNGKFIVSASVNGTTAIWDAKTGIGKYLGGKPQDQHRRSVTSAKFSPDNNFIVTASWDNTAKIWDVRSGKLLQTLQKHSGWVNSAAFSPDGKKVVTSSTDNKTMIWNAADGNLILTLEGHNKSVKSAQFSPEGKKIITTSFDFTARLWDAATGLPDKILMNHKRTVFSAAFSKDSTRVVTASYDGTAKVWDLQTGEMLTDLKGHTNWVYSAMYSPDGKKIVTATDDSTAKVWDAVTGELLTNLKGRSGWVLSAKFSPDGKKIIATYKDSTIKIWDAASGIMRINFSTRKSTFKYAEFSEAGKKAVFVTGRDSIKIYDAFTFDTIHARFWHDGVTSAKFSPDGLKVITASESDSTAKIWNATSGELQQTLSGHDDGVLFAAFSPDNNNIVTASIDRTAIIWNSSGVAKDTLIGHTEKVIYASFSPDSKKLVTSSEDKSARVWDVASGKLLFNLKGHKDWVNSAQFDSAGKKIITASGDNTVKVWNAMNGKLLYTFFAVDSSDYLIVDPSNHYDGTENARNLLYFTCGSEKIGLDQVKGDLWVPNLAERLNNGEVIKEKTLDQLDVCGRIPEVEATGSSDNIYQFTITPGRDSLGETILFVNGIETRRYNKDQLINIDGALELKISKDSLTRYLLANEENWVSVKSYTAGNKIYSNEAKITIEKDESPSEVKTNLYAVMIGTSQYKKTNKNPGQNFDTDIEDLNYPAVDAKAVSRALELAAKKMYGKDHVFIYNLTTDSTDALKPDKRTIQLILLDSIGKKATANDILVLFLSGHGAMSDEENSTLFYYMTKDASSLTDDKAFPEVGISTESLMEWISPKNIPAQKRILILDACHSGQAINDLLGANKIKEIDKLNERSGLFILSASASKQSAFESDKYAHGYLTYSLLKVIKQQPDILEDGKKLNVSRWFNAAGRSVNEIAKEEGNDQKSQIFSVIDFNIGEVDSSVIANIRIEGEKPFFTSSSFQNADTIEVGDNLGLTKTVNDALQEISSKGKESKIVFAITSPAGDSYSLSGSYKYKDNEIKIEIRIRKGKEKLCEFDEKKKASESLKDLADRIIKKAVDCVEAKNN